MKNHRYGKILNRLYLVLGIGVVFVIIYEQSIVQFFQKVISTLFN